MKQMNKEMKFHTKLLEWKKWGDEMFSDEELINCFVKDIFPVN